MSTGELIPDLRADIAVFTVLSSLFDIITAHEPGVRDGSDPEELHDFRVAVRRTRSVLGRMEAVLPEEPGGHFQEEFRWVGRFTGPPRDLDVYIGNLNDYRGHLGEKGTHLDPLEEVLRVRRAKAYARMIKKLDGQRYTDLCIDYREFLAHRPQRAVRKRGRKPILGEANRRIARAHRRVLDRGAAISPESPAGALHELRIFCKKLRYLLELFGPITRPRKAKELTRELKRLQDVLGRHNDHAVQQEQLAHLRTTEDLPQKTAYAMDALMVHLAREQARDRAEFGTRFTRFARNPSWRP